MPQHVFIITHIFGFGNINFYTKAEKSDFLHKKQNFTEKYFLPRFCKMLPEEFISAVSGGKL